jgi:hypothetical protein
VELATRTVVLERNHIKVTLRCRRSGKLALSTRRRGVKLGFKEFRCSNFRAVADVKLKRRIAKTLARRNRTALVARVKVGRKKYTWRLTLRVTKPAQVRAATGLFWMSGSLICGNQYSLVEGLQLSPPLLNSNTNTSGYLWYKEWLYWYGYGWSPGGWVGPFWAPPYGSGALFLSNDYIGVVATGYNYWVAGAVQIYWDGGASDWNYVAPYSPYFGNETGGGYYCHYP